MSLNVNSPSGVFVSSFWKTDAVTQNIFSKTAPVGILQGRNGKQVGFYVRSHFYHDERHCPRPFLDIPTLHPFQKGGYVNVAPRPNSSLHLGAEDVSCPDGAEPGQRSRCRQCPVFYVGIEKSHWAVSSVFLNVSCAISRVSAGPEVLISSGYRVWM